MEGYFDIHCHLLPGVDDGAKDMEAALIMISKAHEEGTRFIVATPHYLAGRKNASTKTLKNLTNELNDAVKKTGKKIEIILGNELMYSSDLIVALNQKDALTINYTRYILLEFMLSASFQDIRNGLNQCIYAGYIPILAHIERYLCLFRKPDLVGELIKLGGYIQINASCLLGGIIDSNANFGHMLLKKEWVHFIGSDAHGIKERPPSLRNAAIILKKKYGEDTVKRLLWDNPLTMMEDKYL